MRKSRFQKMIAVCIAGLVLLVAVAARVHAAIPQQERDALITLYNSTGGNNWIRKDGWLGAAGTECTWFGVLCDRGEATVHGIFLLSNHLSGTIPAELVDLASLRTLNLLSLQPGSNQLSGTIPAKLGNLANLRNLYLSGNQLSGTIPAELGNLAKLVRLDLSVNQLSGTIPAKLGSLANLNSLGLGANQLSGSIPAELGKLGNLQSLLLFSNQLSGPIPAELKLLTSLDSSPCGFPCVDVRWNALFTDNKDLRDFLNSIHTGNDWESTQTIPPVGLSVTKLSDSSYQISWTPIPFAGSMGGYRLFSSTSAGGPYTLAGTTGDKTISSFDVSGLSSSATYYFVIQTFTNPHGQNENLVESEFSYEIATDPNVPVTPVLTSINPSLVLQGEPNFTMGVTGGNFQSGAVVQWNSFLRPTTFVSSTQLEARILTADVMMPGTAQVTVVQGGLTSNSLIFTITEDNQPPVINRLLPSSGATLGNTKVTILGDHFKPELGTTPVINPISETAVIEIVAEDLNEARPFHTDDRTALPGLPAPPVLLRKSLGAVVNSSHEGVFFGGVRVSQVVFVNRTQLEVTTPPNPAGSVDVRVVQSNGSATLPGSYTYKTLPPVPATGPSHLRRQIPFVIDNLEFRTNLGINNLSGSEASVELLLVDPNGLLVAQKQTTVPARGMKQINNVIRLLEEAGDVTGREGYLILDSAANIGAWASQIDNVSLDPSLEIGREERESTNRILMPSSVSTSRFLTSLIVINISANAGTVAIRARDPEGNLRLLVSSQPIAARGYFFFGDFYRAAGLSDVFGPIELEGSEGLQLLATERIFTQENTSAYFEGVDFAKAANTLVLPYSIDTTDFRTNLGINNTHTTAANVRVSLVGRDGLVKGSLTETVPPHGLRQINDINRRLLGKGEVTGEEGTLRLESDQPVLAWTSQIDNLTQDPSLVVGKPSTATRLLIPSTTSLGNFKSTLAVVNLAGTPASVQITARDNDGNVQTAHSVTIPGQGLLSEADIRASLNLAGTFGPLEIVSQDNKPLLAVSRVYSTQRTGGYFEGVAVSSSP